MMPATGDGSDSLASVLPSAAASLGVPGFWDVLGLGEGYRHVVVLLVDGLGLSALTDHADVAPFLASTRLRGIHAAFPTTTPTGLASLGTGLPAGQHGLVGASFMVDGHHGLLHPLNWQEAPSPISVQPEPTVFERLADRGIQVTSIGPRAYAQSGLTRAALRGGAYRGADSVGERIGELIIAVRAEGPALTYIYWPDLDRTGHGHGVDSDHWRSELAHVDYIAEQVARQCRPGDLLVVTADHGMVDVEPDHRIDIDALPALRHQVLNIGGEPRCRYVYTRAGHAEDVAGAWRGELGQHAWVMTRAEAINAGYFGTVDPLLSGRIGDVVVLAKDDWSLASSSVDARVSALRGQHGSMTDAEVAVPLAVIPGGSWNG